MKKNLTPIALTGGLLLGPAAFANHIDFLSDAGFSINADDTTPGSNIQSGAGGNIIGAEREVFLVADFGSYNASLGVPAGPGPVGANSAVILSVAPTGPDAALSIGSLRLTYDNVGNSGLGGLDFDTNWNFLAVTIDSISGGALDLRLTVSDTLGNTGQAAFGALNSAGTYSFAFTDPGFMNAGVNFSSVNSVIFDFETIEEGVGFGISGITREAIPEPGSTVLAALGFASLAFRRRR